MLKPSYNTLTSAWRPRWHRSCELACPLSYNWDHEKVLPDAGPKHACLWVPPAVLVWLYGATRRNLTPLLRESFSDLRMIKHILPSQINTPRSFKCAFVTWHWVCLFLITAAFLSPLTHPRLSKNPHKIEPTAECATPNVPAIMGNWMDYQLPG